MYVHVLRVADPAFAISINVSTNWWRVETAGSRRVMITRQSDAFVADLATCAKNALKTQLLKHVYLVVKTALDAMIDLSLMTETGKRCVPIALSRLVNNKRPKTFLQACQIRFVSQFFSGE